MVVDLAYLPKFLREMPANFGEELRLAVVSELESENAIFVQDGNHGEYRPRKDEFVVEGVPFIRPPNLEHGRIDFSKCDRINELAFARVHKGIGQGGDIILTSNATIGRLAITKPTDPVFVANPQTTIYRSTSPKTLDQRYLYYFMCSDGFQQQLLAHTGRNSTFDYVSLTKQRSLVIPIPSHHRQRKIASILSAHDDLIENNTRRIAILEEMAQAIYREWFVNFRFPGHENVKLVQSTLGVIPEGWKVLPLGEVAEITMGTSPKGNTYNEDGLGTPLINGPVEFADRFAKRVKWTTDPNKMSKARDLIVCVRGSTTGKYVKSDGEYCLGRGVCSIRCNHQSYVDLMFRDELPKLLAQTGGSTFPSWTAPQLKGHLVLSPPPTLLDDFEKIVSPTNEAVFVYTRKNHNLRTTRDLLLPKLIGGQLGVGELDLNVSESLVELDEATA